MKELHRTIYELDFLKSKLFEIVIKIATRASFINYYFKILFKSKNNTGAFYLVNLIYCWILGEYKYSSYHSFKKQRKNYLQN